MKKFFCLLFILLVGCVSNSGVVPIGPDTNEELDIRILALIKAQNFDKLDSILNKIETDYEKDFLKERKVDIAFDTFYRARTELEPLLASWINAKPNSYVAYMARGVYYTKIGWGKRGVRYIDETSKNNLDGMAFYFQKAIADFEHARTINNKMVHPLCYEIEILMNYSQVEQIRKLYEDALQINPMSLTARWYYISTLLPKWGGSIDQIEKVVKSARPYYGRNSALKILDGRVAAEFAGQAFVNQDYAKAEQLYNEALKYGEHWFYIEEKGDMLGYAKQFERSNKDLKRALELRPNYGRAIYMLGMNLYQTNHYTEAIPFLSKVLDDNEFDHKSLDIRGDCYRRIGQFTLALSDVERAIVLDPKNTEYLADREKIRQMMSQVH